MCFSIRVVYALEGGFLTSEEKEILVKAANLMDELIETLDVMQDEELIQDLKDALREVKEGKTKLLSELIKELNLNSLSNSSISMFFTIP